MSDSVVNNGLFVHIKLIFIKEAKMKKRQQFVWLFLTLFLCVGSVSAVDQYYGVCNEINDINVVYMLGYTRHTNDHTINQMVASQLIYEGIKQNEGYQKEYNFREVALSYQTNKTIISLYRKDNNMLSIQLDSSDLVDNDVKHIKGFLLVNNSKPKPIGCFINYTSKDQLAEVSDVNLTKDRYYDGKLKHPLVSGGKPSKKCCSIIGRCCSAIGRCLKSCFSDGGLSDSEYTDTSNSGADMGHSSDTQPLLNDKTEADSD